MKKRPTVFVGLSGGVDSSLTAYLLTRQDYKVVGVYMKNWTEDIGGYRCPWRQDYLDAKRLAAFLDIEFLVFDFQKQYKRQVVDYMLDEYRKGNTPNPDIRCNQTIKFDLFLKTCLQEGADLIATGHYARLQEGRLCRALDESKDQTYFLYRLPREASEKVLFPLGELTKRQVRRQAETLGLPNADRRESMGLCFVGEVGLTDFLKNYVGSRPGPIIDDEGRQVGQHQGAIFYTIGQRRGLQVGGGLPYYVTGKDMTKNEVYVSRDLNHRHLWQSVLDIGDSHWLIEPRLKKDYDLRIRHCGQLATARLSSLGLGTGGAALELERPLPAAAAGQSAVLYEGETVVGGGIIR